MVADSTVQELKAKHGNIHLIEVGELEFVARPPNRHEWDRFMIAVLEGGQKQVQAFRDLALTCVLYPSDLGTLFDAQPALPQNLGKSLSELAGSNQEVRLKKL